MNNQNPSSTYSAPSTPSAPSVPSVEEMITRMSPDQLSKLRMLAAAQGVVAGPRKDADGSSVFEVRVSAELMEQIEQWGDSLAPGTSLTDQVQHWVTEALTAYLYADWRAVTAQAPVVAAAPVTPVVAAPPAAVTVAG